MSNILRCCPIARQTEQPHNLTLSSIVLRSFVNPEEEIVEND